MTRLAIFDLDGTLIDTPSAIVDTFNAVFAWLGMSAPPRTTIRATIGLPLATAFSQLMDAAPDHACVAQAVGRYHELFQLMVLPRAQEDVFPGVEAGLGRLRDQDFLLAVATSKSQVNADALLGAAGLGIFFNVVVGADRVARPKPDPETGKLILSLFGATAEQAVMVGDTTHDLLMAKAMGMRSIAVTYGIHDRVELAFGEPICMTDTFDQVVATIEGMFAPICPGHASIW
jgi:phosphoglycolate phosphatase